MPPRKKKEPKEDPKEIKNLYEQIPQDFLPNIHNPNKHLHKFSLPFRACIVAPSGSGKTNFLLNMLEKFCQGAGTFASITIITRNKDEPLYNWLEKECDQIEIKEGLSSLPQLDKFDKEVNHLVVLDDLVLEKDLSRVEQYYIRCRKKNVSIIFISQKYHKIPQIIRGNCSYMILLKIGGKREINLILSDYGLGVSKEQLFNMYNYATQEKFSPLLIDIEANVDDGKFRRAFTEILNPKDFGKEE
jgi:hypothetical protein